jgi:hypothetical protein
MHGLLYTEVMSTQESFLVASLKLWMPRPATVLASPLWSHSIMLYGLINIAGGGAQAGSSRHPWAVRA